MSNNTYFVSSSVWSQDATRFTTTGVAGNPALAAGFLLGYVLLGIISFVLAFWSQRSRLKDFKQSIVLSFSGQHASLRGVQNVHSSLTSLLLMDVMNAITTIILAVEFARFTCGTGFTCVYVYTAWFLLRYFGVVLHLLSALVCLLFLCHPQWGAKLRCFFTLIVVLIIVLVPFYVFVSQVAIFGMAAVIFGLALAIIVKSTVSTMSPSAAAQKKPIVIISMMMFLLVYVPSFVLQCLVMSAGHSEEMTDYYLIIYVNILFGTSFHIFMDGLLCLFILRLHNEEEEQQEQQQQITQNYGFSANTNTNA